MKEKNRYENNRQNNRQKMIELRDSRFIVSKSE